MKIKIKMYTFLSLENGANFEITLSEFPVIKYAVVQLLGARSVVVVVVDPVVVKNPRAVDD